jgi:ferritin-like metal-binding protein YciE
MALNSPRELFLYELAALRDAERTAGLLLGVLMGSRVQDPDLEQVLRTQEQDSRRQLDNIEACLEALGQRPLETPSPTADAIRTRFEDALRLRPSPEMQDMIAFATATRLVYLAIASYRTLVDWAGRVGEDRCAQNLQANLAEKEESARMLERIGRRMGEGLLATS